MEKFEKYTNIIEKKIEKIHLPQTPQKLYQPLKYILSTGGKRMRPILCLLATELFNKPNNESINQAIAIELFHNFSLIHDDIMDQAPIRRNKKTIHKKWDTNVAILSGDAMLIKAYEYLTKAPNNKIPILLKIFNKTASQVCEGQQLDMDFEAKKIISIDNYIKMIELKTAVLLACSLETGAIMANAEQNDRINIYEFGKNLGIAFQIQDDMLDIFGEKLDFGKQEGGDIISEKKTFLLLKSLEIANENEKKEILFWLTNKICEPKQKIEKIKYFYQKLKIENIVEQEIKKYLNKAIKHLEKINNANLEIKKLLDLFAQKSIYRKK